MRHEFIINPAAGKQKHIRAGYKDTGELRPFTPAAGKFAQAERPFAFIET